LRKRFKFQVLGTVEVIAEDELEARDSASEVVAEDSHDYIGDILKVSELPKCKMSSECRFWHMDWDKFSEEAKKRNPAGCIYYEDGLCTL